MPTLDRRWRLGAFLLALGIAVGVALEAWNVWSTMGIYGDYGPGVIPRLGIDPFGTASLIFMGWWLITALVHARRREQLRARALAGDLDAMPPARIVPGDTATTTVDLLTARGKVSADDEGLHFRRTYKRERVVSVPWGEARLLEVWLSGSGRQSVRGFSFYGDQARLEWTLPRGQNKRTQKQSDAEAALLATIHAHTGLVPHTFAPTLQRPDAHRAERAGPKPFGTIVSIVVALLHFAVAAAVLLLPLATERAMNVYVALTFSVLGLLIMIAVVRTLAEHFRRTPQPDPGAILPPGVPPPDTSGTGIYALRWRERSRELLGGGALGLLFFGNVVPLIALVTGAETEAASGWIGILLFTTIAGIALLGALLLLAVALSGRRNSITADATGLRSGKWALRWGNVEEVVARVPDGSVAGFKVVGDEGEVAIEWPANPHAIPRPGAQALTAAEFAALVVARSGRALRVEED